MELKITKTRGAWTFGTLVADNGEEYRFEVKHYAQPSQWGLDWDGEPGRISKLWVTRARTFGTVCCYDRGWDKLPADEADQDACHAVIERFN